MKKLCASLTGLMLLAIAGRAQNVSINEDGSLPNANAILDIKSGNKGILIPRISSASRMAIKRPEGLLVYDTNTASFWYIASVTVSGPDTVANWKNLATGTAWETGGNITDSSQFLGTVNNIPLRIRVNNQPSGSIDPTQQNTYWGYQAGYPNSGARPDSLPILNTGIGYRSLYANITGQYNTAVGAHAMDNNTTGYVNTAVGYAALRNNTSGRSNAATGTSALGSNTTGHSNVANGAWALGSNTTGYNNAANGPWALGSNTTGYYNSAVGSAALFDNITGSYNTASGENALRFNTSGGYNTAIGSLALHGNLTGSYNTAIGQRATTGNPDLINATAIGSGAVVNASNKVRIGNSAVLSIEGQVNFSVPSDGRFKWQVQEDVKGLDFILQLRPVTYLFDVKRFDAANPLQSTSENSSGYNALQTAYDKAAAIRRSGFIAQEVEKAAVKAGYNFSGLTKPGTPKEHYSLSYEAFVVPLVKAVQEMYTGMQEMRAMMKKLEQENKEMKQLLQKK